MKEYRPTMSPIPGTDAMALEYPHEERKADANALLDGPVSLRLTVRCAKRHRLAGVYKTADRPVIIVYSDTHVDADLRRIRMETGIEFRWASSDPDVKAVADILDAPDDFDLWASCECGRATHLSEDGQTIVGLDRALVREAFDAGRDTLTV